MPNTVKETRLLLGLEALESNEKLSERAAAKIYRVDRRTLARRRAGKPARCDTIPNLRRLTDSEENAIFQYITELSLRAFPLRLRGVEDMANQLLRVCDAPPVGKLWSHNFVRRRPEFRTRFTARVLPHAFYALI
jgi:hypothetical protein